MKDFEKPVGRIIVATYVNLVSEHHTQVCHYVEAVCENFDLTVQYKIYSKLDKSELEDPENYRYLSFEFYHRHPNTGHFALLKGVAAYLFSLSSFFLVHFEKYPYKSQFS